MDCPSCCRTSRLADDREDPRNFWYGTNWSGCCEACSGVRHEDSLLKSAAASSRKGGRCGLSFRSIGASRCESIPEPKCPRDGEDPSLPQCKNDRPPAARSDCGEHCPWRP